MIVSVIQPTVTLITWLIFSIIHPSITLIYELKEQKLLDRSMNLIKRFNLYSSETQLTWIPSQILVGRVGIVIFACYWSGWTTWLIRWLIRFVFRRRIDFWRRGRRTSHNRKLCELLWIVWKMIIDDKDRKSLTFDPNSSKRIICELY